MKKIKFLLAFSLLVLTSCEDYVNNVNPFIDRVVDEALNSQAQIALARIGLLNQSYAASSYILLMSDGLSDALIWDQRISGATYSGYRQLEETTLTDLNSETNSGYYSTHKTRAMADTLITRIGGVTFSSPAKKNEALFSAYLHGAYSRYLLGTYYGRDENTGGATINLGPFLPTSVIYADAINRFKEALKYTTIANEIKIANSLIGRCYLFLGDYANAATHLNLGLVKGDNPFISKFLITPSSADNAYRQQASAESRIQWRVDDRFKAYTTSESTEANRIKFRNYSSTTMLEQRMYIKQADGTTTTPIPLIDWQEVNLMKAELVVRGSMAGDALTLINEIRTSRLVKLLPAGTNITLNTTATVSIYNERDKELFLRGLRLVDQRRFNTFHISYGWKYFPIPQAEKIKNPNYQ